jgi:signal transduction histidine kinase
MRFDVLLAVAMTISGQVEVWAAIRSDDVTLDGPAALAFAGLTLVGTSLLAVRRRWPVVVGLVVPAAEALSFAVVTDHGSIAAFTSSLIAVYSAAAWSTRRWSWVVLAARILGAVLVGDDAGDWAFVSALSVGATAAGLVVRRQRDIAVELRAMTEALGAERDARARLAVAEERSSIAREVHDILGHTVSVMVVQAEAAEALLDRDPAGSRAALRAVQTTGREALAELRRVLPLLRNAEAVSAEIEPQPRLERLPDLLSRVRDAGLDVSVVVGGRERRLAPGVDLCAYRIIQESLTNSLRHVGQGAATITLRYRQDGLDVEVADSGRCVEGAPISTIGTGSSLGLVGLRERVALCRGELNAHENVDGGFVVRAWLPDLAGSR